MKLRAFLPNISLGCQQARGRTHGRIRETGKVLTNAHAVRMISPISIPQISIGALLTRADHRDGTRDSASNRCGFSRG